MSPAESPGSDATEAVLRKRLAAMERALRLNEVLVAGLVHDLRTPLMAIKLSAEVALAKSSDEAAQQAARRIRVSSDRLSRTFDHLLNLSRVGADVPELELRAADLGAIATAAIEESGRGLGADALAVTREGDLGGWFDPVLLGRTLVNMLGTALEQRGEQGQVSVHLDGTHRDRIVVRVSAPGVIPPDVQERMYVPGPSVAGREVLGLGLGLEPVDRFVRAHGGSVVGRSRAAEGTVFELLLPRGLSEAA
jgi:signal transduction histidine kinase